MQIGDDDLAPADLIGDEQGDTEMGDADKELGTPVYKQLALTAPKQPSLGKSLYGRDRPSSSKSNGTTFSDFEGFSDSPPKPSNSSTRRLPKKQNAQSFDNIYGSDADHSPAPPDNFSNVMEEAHRKKVAVPAVDSLKSLAETTLRGELTNNELSDIKAVVSDEKTMDGARIHKKKKPTMPGFAKRAKGF